MPIQLTAPTLPQDDAAPAFAAVYREHHGFVARTLRHLGVDPGRVDDAVQDTFLVVHRRLAEFEGRAALRTWLGRLGYHHFPRDSELTHPKDHPFTERLLGYHIAEADRHLATIRRIGG